MKVAGSTPEPAAPTNQEPAVPEPSMGDDMGAAPTATDDKPFDDKPFDAGVEADEESDPKKFIEQLTGKLGQSLRTYTESQGQPDFDLEKFAINSLLSATHTAEMTPEDQKDIINKVKKSGAGDENVAPEANSTPADDLGGEAPSMDEPADDLGGDEPTDELNEIQVNSNNTLTSPNLDALKSIIHFAFEDLRKNNIKPNEHDIFNYIQWYYTSGKNLNEEIGGILSEFINPDKLKPLAKKPAISRDELHMILQMIYNSVDISGQYRIMDVYKALGFPFGESSIMESKTITMSGATAFPWRYDSEEAIDGSVEAGEVGGIQEMDNLFLTNVPKNNLFQPGTEITEACWKGYRQVGMKEKNGKTVPNCVPVDENKGLWANIHAKRKRGESPLSPSDEDYPDKKQWDKLTKEESAIESKNYMFWQNLKSINDNAAEILGMNTHEVDKLLSDGHSWAVEHVITSKDDVEEVYHFLEHKIEVEPNIMGENKDLANYMFFASLKTILHATSKIMEMDEDIVDSMLSDGHGWAIDHLATAADDMEEVYHFLANTLDAYDGDTDAGYNDEFGNVEAFDINEAEYQGKTVKLGKPMRGDVKKFKVFVKNKKGKVIKVNFGDPNMEIKRDDPERKKSFRARHKCAQAKDRTKPKYWSCKMWSKKPVSKMVAENLSNQENYSIFDKDYLRQKLAETFKQEDSMNEPQVAPTPEVAPSVAPSPSISPKRKNQPFLPMPDVQPDPKATNKN